MFSRPVTNVRFSSSYLGLENSNGQLDISGAATMAKEVRGSFVLFRFYVFSPETH